MCSIAVKIPDEVLYDTKMTEAEASDFAKKAIAVMLYSKNHISIGYCAQIAGMPEEDFIKYLYTYNIISLVRYREASIVPTKAP